MISEGQSLTGDQKPILVGRERDLLSSQWLPPLGQATIAGRTFYLTNQAQTMAATHNTPIAAATATPIVGFLNPATSKKNAVILYGWFANVSGTPAAQAHPVWNYATGTAAISTTPSGSIINGYLQHGSNSGMRAYNNTALTGLVAASFSLGAVRPFGIDSFAGALAAGGQNGSTDYVDGSIVVPPGTLIGIFAGTGAGTSWVVSAGIAWVETDA